MSNAPLPTTFNETKALVNEWNEVYHSLKKRLFSPDQPLSIPHVAYVISCCLDDDTVSIPEVLDFVRIAAPERKTILGLAKASSFISNNISVIERIVCRITCYTPDRQTVTTIRSINLLDVVADIVAILREELGETYKDCLYLARLVYAAAATLKISPQDIKEGYSSQQILNRAKSMWNNLVSARSYQKHQS